MRVLTNTQTAAQLPFDILIQTLEDFFKEGCEVPLRHNHAISGNTASDSGILLLMPAWQPGKRLGVKTVSIFPNNSARGLPGLHSVFILYDAATGAPLAILDGDVITSRRTAAASALAAKWLSRPDSSTLLVVGAGRVGSLLPEAYRSVRPIERVLVWNRLSESADTLVGNLREQGIDAHAVNSLEDAAQEADIITCATLSTAPLIQGKWLKPGVHLDLIGGFTPAMRESDDECMRKGTVFLDTTEALLKAGDILAPIESGAFNEQRVAATLEQLCRGQHPGRTSRDEITVFKAVGTALEDLAAASLAYDAFQANPA
ncbi:MAG: ornithine cyclodeaminase family protein [Gammaproteobacteria bacterium]|nr:ornithine cyclodeaminase family protein [Gammaproteobacteria bacterium]MBU0806664.1 ornithine cyclodeaminase family protein [Gammaproteobacteria bacterium]MBU0882504.1 ornithine cyclodeaminase family protein [Gammaproteobacteria bacterium]MBU0900897.1 ornithine cyclodeaminase family protein [Gammaproteobacteria bacterium]MBU1861095.1 ornithine cyclodeaminase family protein [Gammaproteobacteria bacterium]